MSKSQKRTCRTICAGLCFAAMLLGAAGSAAAQDKTPPKPLDEIEAEQTRLSEQRRALNDSADAPNEWKELRKLQQQIAAQEDKDRRNLSKLHEQRIKLAESDAASAWSGKIRVINKELDRLREQQYDLMHSEGEALIRARHEELAKAAAGETPQLKALALDVLTFPRLDGSTSTQPLAALIACRAFDMPYEWVGRDERREDPDRNLLHFFGGPQEPEIKLMEFSLRARADAGQERLAAIINHLLAANASTNTAYVNLIEGRSDLGLLARGPSSDELALAKKSEVELDITPCALDAFVFLVHRKNPIPSLTLKQLRSIYSAKTTNWKTLNQYDGEITAYQREENSGSQVLMRELVMKDVPLFKPAENRRAPQLIGYLMSSPYIEISENNKGIGYSVFYYKQYMMGSRQTRTIAVEGVAPSFDTIRNRKYPLVSEVVVVSRKDLAPDSAAAKLRRWLLSPEGQAVVQQSGYVPVVEK